MPLNFYGNNATSGTKVSNKEIGECKSPTGQGDVFIVEMLQRKNNKIGNLRSLSGIYSASALSNKLNSTKPSSMNCSSLMCSVQNSCSHNLKTKDIDEMIIFSEDEEGNSSLSSSMDAIDEKHTEEATNPKVNVMLDSCKLITDLKPSSTNTSRQQHSINTSMRTDDDFNQLPI
jgi:hypothetical protein